MPKLAAVLRLAVVVQCCWVSGVGSLPAVAQNHQNHLTEPFSLEALPTRQLMAALGRGGANEGVQICLEIVRRFRESTPTERSATLSQLAVVLESDPQPDPRFGAIACLAGLVSAPVDPDTQAAVAEIVRNVLSAESDPTILTAALRLMPDVDRSQRALIQLSDLLNNLKLMQAHPGLAKEALLSAGRFGPHAIPLLMSFLPTFPEASMIALSATGGEEAVNVLIKEASGSDADRRYYAVHALGLCTGSEELSDENRAVIIRTLERAAQTDSEPHIRQKAMEWLKETRQPPFPR